MNKILIIDDEINLRETIIELLSYSGYEVYEAGNGKDGIEKTKEIEPNLILCDIMMPVLDGYGFLKELKKTKFSQIPVIFISAKVAIEDQARGINLGAKGYIEKPFKFKELISAVKLNIMTKDLK
jgi:two-component system chemotaxis response regulator CheY